MRNIYLFLAIVVTCRGYSQLNYSFSSTTGAYSYLSSGTVAALSSNTSDESISNAITLPFTFYYNCQPYTQIKVSSNGWLTFNTSLTSSYLTNDLDNTGSLIVAPLWDDLACTQNVVYTTTGTAPNRIFKIEWRDMEWNYSASGAVISFQVWLYETTNRIEFWYRRESTGVNSGSASIGLNGSGTPLPFLSLNGTGGSPTASSTTETDNLNTKPANGQIYRWDPVSCSGTPNGFTLNATPQIRCSNFTTTLSLTGNANGCGITYDWQTSPNLTTWTTFSTGAIITATYNVTGVRYFRVVLTCTASGQSYTTNVINTNVISSPCVCGLIQIPSLPYVDNGKTTCGEFDDVTSTNVTNVCGSTNYYGGEDAVYSFTPSMSGAVNITINSSGSYTGLMLYRGCPLSGGICVTTDQSSTGSKTLNCVPVTAGQVYYLVIDSWPSPTCNPYDLTISSVTTGIVCSCKLIQIPSLPYSSGPQTTCGKGDDIKSTNVTNVCGSASYYTGEDAIYSFTPTTTGPVNIYVNSSGSYVGLMVYQGCPLSGGTCIGNSQSSAGNQQLCTVNVTAGQVYYIVIDSWASPTCNPYELVIQPPCTGTPTGFSITASPQTRCSNFTTTLSLVGGAGSCPGSYTYQWQTATSLGGPWTNFGTSATTATYNVTGLRYFRLQVTCTNSGLSAFTNTVTTNVISSPCVCGLIQIPSLPYVDNGKTTCGEVNDVTSANVTNVCGSTNYYGGEDAVYSFTPSASGQITITVNSSGSYTGLMLYQGCPLSGGTCVFNSQSSTGSKTISCINVTAGQVYYLVIDSWPSPTCNPYDLSISSVVASGAACNMNYSASSVTYSFETFTGTSLPMTDDVLFNSIVMFGFNTCFDGGLVSGGYPASNSSFVYDAYCNIPNIQSTSYAASGVWTHYSITNAAPVFGTSIPRNAILGPWHDINPASSATVATSKIQYATFGTAPNRRTVISWEDIPYFSCNGSVTPYFSGQIKIFENGNIEIHIKNKHLCTSWNGGAAVMGLHNYDGTIYIPPVNPTAHNYPTQWTMTNTAYRFTPAPGCVTSCAVLPIGFKSFYGERVNKVNYLYWETAEESDLLTYEILRSTDGINFEKIGNTPPNNFPSKYKYEDVTAPLGKISYYKIRSIEKFGKQSETQMIAIDAQMDEVFVTGIFPNPANEEVNISIESRLTSTNGFAKVSVYDMFGRRVISREIKLLGGVNNYKIEIASLPQGVYMFEVIVNNGEKVIEKIIKE